MHRNLHVLQAIFLHNTVFLIWILIISSRTELWGRSSWHILEIQRINCQHIFYHTSGIYIHYTVDHDYLPTSSTSNCQQFDQISITYCCTRWISVPHVLQARKKYFQLQKYSISQYLYCILWQLLISVCNKFSLYLTCRGVRETHTIFEDPLRSDWSIYWCYTILIPFSHVVFLWFLLFLWLFPQIADTQRISKYRHFYWITLYHPQNCHLLDIGCQRM